MKPPLVLHPRFRCVSTVATGVLKLPIPVHIVETFRFRRNRQRERMAGGQWASEGLSLGQRGGNGEG